MAAAWPETSSCILFSGTHFITGTNGPTRAMATGGLRFWKDGRDAPDVMLGLFDYREGFNLSLRVNFVDGGEESEGLIFTGSEGTMEIAGNAVSVSRMPLAKGTWLHDWYIHGSDAKAHSGKLPAKVSGLTPIRTSASWNTRNMWRLQGYRDSYDHFKNFFAAVRSRQPVVEDAVFGFRAAGAALLSNLSIDRGAVMKWDPDAMKLV